MRGRVLFLRGWMRLAAYGLVAAALVLASLHIHRMSTHPVKPATPVRAPIDEMLHELEHCRDSGTAAQDDKACIAVWQENRRRFFQEGRVQ
jgi:conjugative transfer region protein TrbK